MSLYKKIGLLVITVSCHTFLFAQAPAPASIEDPFVVTMIIIMILLALIIGLLAWVVLGSAQVYLEKSKQEEATTEKKSNPVTAAATVLVALLGSLAVQAEETGAGVVVKTHNISDTAFYTMAGVIFLELIVIGALLYNLRVLLEIKRKKAALAGQPAKSVVNWWSRLNRFKPVEQETSLDLGHEYDGIRELDNRLPPWWLYGFYLTIIFAGIYLWRYHVSHAAPSSGEEYQLAVRAAEAKRAEFLKKAANNVDENTVKYLAGSEDLAAGQKIYATTCFPCHGKQGEGGVGPNLTDDYWLHGGSVKDILKTIKYGVPEKGMKSWKDDYSPVQLAQLASYIKSIKGTNPPNAKTSQGTIYQEESAKSGDSTTVTASGK